MSEPRRLHQDLIDQQAGGWVVRLADGSLRKADQRELAAWLASDPRHQSTFDALSRTWGEIAELSPPNLSAIAPEHDVLRKRRGFVLAAAGAAIAASLALIVAPLAVTALLGKRYATGLAEMRIVTLSDGSSITLAPRSALRVRKERSVELIRGEAFFDVVHNAAKPFVVWAGNSVVEDLGTKFDVKVGKAYLHVSVSEGAVQVGHAGRPATAGVGLIKAGQRTEILLKPVKDRAFVSALKVSPSQSTASWREGWLVFDDAPLSEVVADVNRYYAPGVSLEDPAAGALHVTASFKVSEVPTFIVALERTLPIEAGRRPGGGFVLRSNADPVMSEESAAP